jgi:hypothetical protein
MPSNAQEKYELLASVMQRWRDIGGRATEFYSVLEREYRNVFELVSFRFDDPDQQLMEDLGLEDLEGQLLPRGPHPLVVLPL